MTGSMYAGIAGLKTHMTAMNVIGHNIANVNTTAYKSQRYIFEDALYTMYSSGSDGSAEKGGMNPSQIGYGSGVSTIDLNMASGTYAPGRSLDCMITGDGFFLVGDKQVPIDPTDPNSLKNLLLTRAGNFDFDASGYLVDGNGQCVYGFLSTGVLTADMLAAAPDAYPGMEVGDPIISDQLVAIRLPKMEMKYARKDLTTGVETPISSADIAGMDPAALEGELKAGTIVETGYEVLYPTDKAADPNAGGGGGGGGGGAAAAPTYIPLTDAGEDLPFAALDGISIDAKTGRISGTTKDTDEWITIGFLAIGNVTNPNGVTHEGGFYYKAGDGTGDMQVALLGGAAEELGITHVNGSLAAAGTTLPDLMRINSAGTTSLTPGGLEGSNADLATEISNLIVVQRGYQANTRVITVTDAMLEELVNMKR